MPETKTTPPQDGAGVWPVALAIGVTVLLVGLVIDPLVLAPLGLVITGVAGAGWVRASGRTPDLTAPDSLETYEPAYETRYARSRVLERATLGLGAVVGLAATLPAIGFAVLPSFRTQQGRGVDLGPIGAFPQGQFVVATFLSDPMEGEVSRRTAYIRNNGLTGNAPSFTILSSRCTHVGCPTEPGAVLDEHGERHLRSRSGGTVDLVPALGLTGFGCPCHGSQFDTEGNRTAGPAPRPLDRYEYSIINGRLTLDRLISVGHVYGAGATARFQRFGQRAAGEPTEGGERFLYPIQPS
jgi:Rieske Fe-S protein